MTNNLPNGALWDTRALMAVPPVRLFGRLSIKKKLVLIIMLVSSTTMMLAGGAFIAYQWFAFRQQMVADLSAQTEMLVENCTVALSFDMPKDANDVLESLRKKSSVAFAGIHRPDGSLFAEYKRKGFSGKPLPASPKQQDGYRFEGAWLVMYKQVIITDEIVGTLYLQSDLSELYGLIRRIAIPLALLILLASIPAYILSAKLQQVISRPILHLAKTAKKISTNEDYSVRAVKHSVDEMGLLTDAFNNMLSQVERRDIALRESEEKYRSLYDTSRDAIMILNPEGRIISGNPSTIELFGFKDEKEFVSNLHRNLSPKYQPGGILSKEKVKEVITLTLKKGSHFFEWKYKRIDGEEFHAEVLLNRMRLQDEEVIHASIRNITDRKQDEEELRRLRNLLSNIINSMPSVLVGVDIDGRVTHWNREAEKITGVNADDARGNRLADVFPQLAGEMDKVGQAVRDREPLKEEKIPSEVDGEIRYSDVTVYPLISDGIEGAVIRMDDITERVLIEEMVIQSEKMLSVGGLAAGMAHEINNPLAGILQNVQVIRNRIRGGMEKNSQVAEESGTTIEIIENYVKQRGIFTMIEAVMESGRRASKIVDNMLNFSRKSDSNFIPEDMAALLDKTIELASNDYDLKKKYDFRQIEIHREFGAGVPKVYCDAGKIQQVFLNLLKNGAQAMAERKEKKEPPRFVLRIMHDDDVVRMEIEDNGPGVDEGTRKRIFEPFFTTKGVGVGTGLGLSVSYFIITENHNGTMIVDSAPGKGTNFIIRLPLERSI
ncbi:MAG: PAS domain S-box protein [Candidatus Aminicenantes bacterium]|nr:PAS domain S-box protein [Candidatus Aminicenantes bacterium]